MTKSELLKALMKRFPDMDKKNISQIVTLIFSEISHGIVKGQRVEIRGFGAFSLRKRRARKARNPRTNEVVELNERNSLYFRAGKELREMLNR